MRGCQAEKKRAADCSPFFTLSDNLMGVQSPDFLCRKGSVVNLNFIQPAFEILSQYSVDVCAAVAEYKVACYCIAFVFHAVQIQDAAAVVVGKHGVIPDICFKACVGCKA